MLAPITGSRRDGKSRFRTLTRYPTEGRDKAGKEHRAQTEKRVGIWEPPKRFILVGDAEQTKQPEAKRYPQQ